MTGLVENACGGNTDLSGGDRYSRDAVLAFRSLLVGDQVERVAREVVVGINHTHVANKLVVHHQIMRSSIDHAGHETGDGLIGEDGDGEVHVGMPK